VKGKYRFGMKIPLLPRRSLRARFTFGFAAVLLPFLLAAAIGQFYFLPRMLGPLEEIVYEVAEEMRPVAALEIALLEVRHAGHDYLIQRHPVQRDAFARSVRRAEGAIQVTFSDRFHAEEERTAIRTARGEWEQAWPLADALLQLPEPVGSAAAARDMERVELHLDRALDALGQIREKMDREINEERAKAQAARQEAMLLTAAVIAIALGIALTAGTLLGRYVLGSVDALRLASRRLEEGDLTARVTLNVQDEFAEVAAAFNTMAAQLEKSYAALQETASRDGLTGLFNRRELDSKLGEELARCKRYGHALSLLLVDLDHFKVINDSYGHPAGDKVLRGIADIIRGPARRSDVVARYGGEEFAVIMPETEKSGAQVFAERIRLAVAGHTFSIDNKPPLNVTVSVGVAGFPGDAGTDAALIAAADSALYDAKRAGRDCVRSFGLERCREDHA
jgi:diguanylate cyclase (GGDEF)-like protein